MTESHSGRGLKQLVTLYLQLGSTNPSSGHTTVPSEMDHYLPPLTYPYFPSRQLFRLEVSSTVASPTAQSLPSSQKADVLWLPSFIPTRRSWA